MLHRLNSPRSSEKSTRSIQTLKKARCVFRYSILYRGWDRRHICRSIVVKSLMLGGLRLSSSQEIMLRLRNGVKSPRTRQGVRKRLVDGVLSILSCRRRSSSAIGKRISTLLERTMLRKRRLDDWLIQKGTALYGQDGLRKSELHRKLLRGVLARICVKSAVATNLGLCSIIAMIGATSEAGFVIGAIACLGLLRTTPNFCENSLSILIRGSL